MLALKITATIILCTMIYFAVKKLLYNDHVSHAIDKKEKEYMELISSIKKTEEGTQRKTSHIDNSSITYNIRCDDLEKKRKKLDFSIKDIIKAHQEKQNFENTTWENNDTDIAEDKKEETLFNAKKKINNKHLEKKCQKIVDIFDLLYEMLDEKGFEDDAVDIASDLLSTEAISKYLIEDNSSNNKNNQKKTTTFHSNKKSSQGRKK